MEGGGGRDGEEEGEREKWRDGEESFLAHREVN